jgi:hypothetical protein
VLRSTLGSHIELRAGPADQPAVVLADRGRIEQMLLNLTVDARDAMPEGAAAGSRYGTPNSATATPVPTTPMSLPARTCNSRSGTPGTV